MSREETLAQKAEALKVVREMRDTADRKTLEKRREEILERIRELRDARARVDDEKESIEKEYYKIFQELQMTDFKLSLLPRKKSKNGGKTK